MEVPAVGQGLTGDGNDEVAVDLDGQEVDPDGFEEAFGGHFQT